MSADAFKKINFQKALVTVLFLGLIVAAVFIFNNYFAGKQSALADAQNSLTTTGTVEAKSVVASFKVPGKIAKLYCDEGSNVQAGQKLANLDSIEIAAKLSQAQGAYQSAQAQAREASEAVPLNSQQVEAAIDQAGAKVAQAKTSLSNAQKTYDRMTALHQEQAISDNDYDKAVTSYTLAQNQLTEAEAALNQALSARLKVQVSQSQYQAALGQVEQARGVVQEAQAALDNTLLKSPLTGYITQKYLEEGEMVNAGTPVLEIADLNHTYVKIFIDEKKIGRVHLKQEAEIKVDAYPGKVFRGGVVWINDAGEFAVQKAVNEQYSHDIRSFEVKVDVPNPDLTLKVGMTATVKLLEESK
ncbi:HlyD family secretion protein [Desulfotomaculum arcticum]|uniref:HlyD family secretion protein n=1 Tax=Desulfotruncus arcticus DSM 17038 TaxID=1121424 RepID=A0A1I2PHJ5_9FIRM|nr:efflux RND transporter periplasmic adaptor subunit [Desulfotruncus arcticus]SFG15655.1 HlyD family secretion protein [Desulfotomaculum arcticum] [Desulfotruncus arcticus DSM 17038]